MQQLHHMHAQHASRHPHLRILTYVHKHFQSFIVQLLAMLIQVGVSQYTFPPKYCVPYSLGRELISPKITHVHTHTDIRINSLKYTWILTPRRRCFSSPNLSSCTPWVRCCCHTYAPIFTPAPKSPVHAHTNWCLVACSSESSSHVAHHDAVEYALKFQIKPASEQMTRNIHCGGFFGTLYIHETREQNRIE